MSDERAIALERMQHMVEAADAIAAYVARGRDAFDADQAAIYVTAVNCGGPYIC